MRWEIWTKNVEFNFFERSYIPPRTGLSEDTKFNVKVSTRKIPQNYFTKVKNKVMRLNLLGGNIKSQKQSVVQSESRNVLKWPKYQNRVHSILHAVSFFFHHSVTGRCEPLSVIWHSQKAIHQNISRSSSGEAFESLLQNTRPICSNMPNCSP